MVVIITTAIIIQSHHMTHIASLLRHGVIGRSKAWAGLFPPNCLLCKIEGMSLVLFLN